jgi:hypothetical protein
MLAGMTITTIPFSARKAGPYTATAGQTSFSFAFPVLNAQDLTVWRERAGVVAQLALGTHYAVSGVGEQSGGAVVLTSGALADDIIAIDGDLLKERSTSFVGGTPFVAATIDADLNRLAIMAQELAREVSRAIRRTAVNQQSGGLVLPESIPNAFLAWDNEGKDFANRTLASIGAAGFPVVSTDNAVPRFDGTDGTTLQNSGVTIDDSNNVAGVGMLNLLGNVTNAAAFTGSFPILDNHIDQLLIRSDKPSVLALIEANQGSPDATNNDPVLWVQKYTRFDNGTDRFAHQIGGVFSDVLVDGQNAGGATNVDGTWISLLGNVSFENANHGTAEVQDWDGFGSTIGVAGFARTDGYPGASCVVTALWGYAMTPSMDDTTFDNLPGGENFSTIGCEININVRHKDPGARTVVAGHGNTVGNYLFNFRTAGQGVRDWTFGQALAGSPNDGDFGSIDPNNWNGFHVGILVDKIKSAGILMGQYFKSGAYGIKWPISYPATAMRPSAAMHWGDNQVNLGQYTGATFNDNDFWHNGGTLFFRFSGTSNRILQERSNVVTLNSTTDFATSNGTQFAIGNVASAVNKFTAFAAAALGAPALAVTGSDTNIDIELRAKGTGRSFFASAGGTQFQVTHTASAVNFLSATGAPSGSPPSLSAVGSGTDIDVSLAPKGAGRLRFGTFVGTTSAINGYIEIKDAAGNIRKLATLT